MGRSEVDAALERLVSQFASPYDFLRELVQNSMDAGSERVEVSMERHLEAEGGTAGDGKDAVFELVVMDTGVGMDESIIDGALTRLFASTKADDRTMAGGFGVGFVSVFAWEPEVVLVQTGKGGEAWELTFHADHSFEKTRLDLPVEGTTITLLRRADAGAYAAVADAVRDSLWRWCRYTQVELSFEDFSEGEGPELIQDAPTPEDFVLSRAEKVGDGHVRVAFGIPPHAVMMRRGLILEEGAPGVLIPGLAKEGRSGEHLALWVDSPELETTLARDSIVQSKGREEIEAKVLKQVDLLREDLLAQLEALCADLAPWTASKQARYSSLQAHLDLEWDQLDKSAHARRILRAHDPEQGAPRGGLLAWSPLELKARLGGGPLVVAGKVAEDEKTLVSDKGWGSAWPVLTADVHEDLWVASWAARFKVDLTSEVELLARWTADAPRAEEDLVPAEEALLAQLKSSLTSLVGTSVKLVLVACCDEDDKDPPLCAWRLGEVAMTSRRNLPAEALGDLLLDRRHLLVQACLRTYVRAPLAITANLASAILSCTCIKITPKALEDHMWQVRGNA